MRKIFPVFIILAIVVLALVPLISMSSSAQLPWLTGTTIAALNFLGWFVVFAFVLWRIELTRSVGSVAKQVGIGADYLPFEALLSQVLREINRRNKALSLNLLEKRIASEEELSRSLERIVALAFKLLDANSAELALFDKETGMYHSSFVLGKPFRTSAQAMLSGAVENESTESSPDVIIQPIAFAGAVLGSLRVALKSGKLPSTGDRQIMGLLALQSGMAIINAQYTDQLLKMRHASEETIKAKTGFLANLSHELRGPLGIMINAVELVLDGLCGPVSEDQADTLQMIRSNGDHLLELINDVLDYAKIESGKITPNKVDILVHDIMKDITAVVRKQAEAKKHVLKFSAGEEALAIACDRRHLRQILINLLTNAIKYTPDQGMIEVWAERIPGNKIKLNVKDNGIGIENSDQYKVFSAFERIENSYSITQAGTGLGMPLTRSLAQVNGGLVDFRSEPGQGSHFWVVFPAIDAGSSIAEAAPEEEAHAKGRGELVLLVQRDDGEQKMITRYLAHVGFAVVPASSKVNALDVLRKQDVSIVIIDNNIVDKPGDDVVGSIRESAKASSLPVILISSRAFIFDIEKYLKSGIDRCLIKPVQLKQLGIICRSLIDGSYTGDVIDESVIETKDSTNTGTVKT
ncbi:hybrid sensor histidine kinase/response regulator, partial [Oligoflexia bacterium]|nr:hybrid sensor histidine kinase/response regulator [Oligoflexia bacterium]